jgi:hypothetical protein
MVLKARFSRWSGALIDLCELLGSAKRFIPGTICRSEGAGN